MVTRRLSDPARAGSQTHAQMLSFEDSAIRVAACFWRADQENEVGRDRTEKTDSRVDAKLMRDMVRQNPSRFRAWRPDDVMTRSLRLLTEGRRNLVNQSTALTNQLTALLKGYYPQALAWVGMLDTAWACDFLEQWPT